MLSIPGITGSALVSNVPVVCYDGTESDASPLDWAANSADEGPDTVACAGRLGELSSTVCKSRDVCTSAAVVFDHSVCCG